MGGSKLGIVAPATGWAGCSLHWSEQGLKRRYLEEAIVCLVENGEAPREQGLGRWQGQAKECELEERPLSSWASEPPC